MVRWYGRIRKGNAGNSPSSAAAVSGSTPAESHQADLQRPAWWLSNGEVHFLWHFIDGSIMNPDTRAQLHGAWGMCTRHSFGFMTAEAAFRGGFMHGPAVLYDDLMERAMAVVGTARTSVPKRLIAHRLGNKASCIMCANGYGPDSPGRAPLERVRQGSNTEILKAFAIETKRWWRAWVCGACAGVRRTARCREHLRRDLLDGRTSLQEQRPLVSELAEHVKCYARSFRWELRGTDTGQDRAALIGSVAWCSGWAPWLELVSQH